MISSIKNNTISEADTKKKINELNEIKKAQIKGKRLIKNQEKLLSLFDDLKTIFNNSKNSNNINNNESDSNNKNESKNENKNENKNVNNNVNENENENENKNDDEQCYEIRQLNNWFETIDQTKSLEEQIEILKTKDFLDEYWYVGYYHGDKELNYKIFKAKAAHLLNDLDEQLFEKIFGHTFAALVDKLINTTSKEENQIIIDDIENNKDKIYEEYKFDESIFKQRGNLYDAVKIILEINELLTLDEDNND